MGNDSKVIPRKECMKKFYFAGSIRGGRERVGTYVVMNELLNKYGEVLDKHVGSPDVFKMEEGLTSEQKYQRDVDWIQECDMLVAEVSTPSLGVGYEVAYAEKCGKRIICCHDEAVTIGCMISGNPHCEIISYRDEDDLLIKLEEKIK